MVRILEINENEFDLVFLTITKILCKRSKKCRKMHKIKTNSIKNLFTIQVKCGIIKPHSKYTLYVSNEG